MQGLESFVTQSLHPLLPPEGQKDHEGALLDHAHLGISLKTSRHSRDVPGCLENTRAL